MRRRVAADVRRPVSTTARAVACAAALVLAVAALTGCAADASTETETDPMDTVYIEYMAALTLSIEEGLSGETAEARIAELGVEPLSRNEIDGHIQRLSRDPVRWSRLEEQVEERVEELRREVRTRVAPSGLKSQQRTPPADSSTSAR